MQKKYAIGLLTVVLGVCGSILSVHAYYPGYPLDFCTHNGDIYTAVPTGQSCPQILPQSDTHKTMHGIPSTQDISVELEECNWGLDPFHGE